MDFVAIGDTVVDEFIRLKDASVHCDVNNEHCTITMRWGDKIPYENAELVVGVGNAANAAVAAARLGLRTSFVSNVGEDAFGREIIEHFEKEGVDTRHIKAHASLPTNHHYVLMYDSERTILIRHTPYPYELPDIAPPKWLYLSSLASGSETFHEALARWVKKHKETKLAFQPGTYQIQMGKTKLAALYKVCALIACNFEEAQRILESSETDIKKLVAGLHALGPKIVLLTDGRKGAYGSDGREVWSVPLYPDVRKPLSRTGAGDAFTSTVVAALALGKPLSEALLWGPVNSMHVVQYVGAQKGLLSREELLAYLDKAPPEYRTTLL